ncbi:MAG TPA: hypothetical protein VF515_21260 [Candidatus Binatia bacterium]|jgi:hypothetical protein
MRIDVVLLSGMLTLGATAGCAGRTTKVAQTVGVEEPAPATGTDEAQPRRRAKTTVTTTTTAESDKSASGIVGSAAAHRDPGDPIQLMWVEGDVAGMTSILSVDGTSTIGFVDYHQRRRGDVLEAVRIARFNDGSTDEDRVEARIGKTLQTIRGRSIIRNAKGVRTVDITIDVAGGRITGFSGLGEKRETYDERVELPPGTYWGPLIFIVIKNFEQNAVDGRLVFRTVVPTPKPRVLDMELLRQEETTVRRPGGKIDVVRFALRPTVNWLIDPVLHMLTPETNFFVKPGAPPGLARFQGPRNFAGQKIRIE